MKIEIVIHPSCGAQIDKAFSEMVIMALREGRKATMIFNDKRYVFDPETFLSSQNIDLHIVSDEDNVFQWVKV